MTACTVTRPVVKIGLVAPFEGTYRYVGYDAIYAARLAVRQANAAGGVGGYTVELVAYDDGGTVEGARVAARNLTRDPQVVAVIGHFLDGTTAAARPIYAQADIPLITAGTVTGGAEDWLCPLLNVLPGEVGWMGPVEGVRSACLDRVFLFESLTPPASVGSLVIADDPVTAGERLLFLRALGWDGPVAGGPALGSPLFAQVAGEQAGGVVFAAPYRWPDARDAEFSAAYQAVGPHAPPPGPFALTTYAAVQGVLADIAAGRPPGGRQPATVYLYRRASDGAVELLSQN